MIDPPVNDNSRNDQSQNDNSRDEGAADDARRYKALRVRAARCRRLAAYANDERTSEVLKQMAEEYDAEADHLARARRPEAAE